MMKVLGLFLISTFSLSSFAQKAPDFFCEGYVTVQNYTTTPTSSHKKFVNFILGELNSKSVNVILYKQVIPLARRIAGNESRLGGRSYAADLDQFGSRIALLMTNTDLDQMMKTGEGKIRYITEEGNQDYEIVSSANGLLNCRTK